MTEHYRNKEGVIAFVFGGSVAKGMERPDSDLDGMVVASRRQLDFEKWWYISRPLVGE